jgi:hypothetical protein
MANMTLSIPDELMERMKKFEEIKWSTIARHAFEKRLIEFEQIEKIAFKSKGTKKDAEEIAEKIKSSLAKRLNL